MKIYATQGGGYAEIVGSDAYFLTELNIPGAYHFHPGDKVPDQWDLALTQFQSIEEIA